MRHGCIALLRSVCLSARTRQRVARCVRVAMQRATAGLLEVARCIHRDTQRATVLHLLSLLRFNMRDTVDLLTSMRSAI